MFDKDTNKDGLTVMETLTDTLADSVNGYRDAAQHVDSAEFRQMFTELADERSQVLSDLQSELARFGGSADKSAGRPISMSGDHPTMACQTKP